MKLSSVRVLFCRRKAEAIEGIAETMLGTSMLGEEALAKLKEETVMDSFLYKSPPL